MVIDGEIGAGGGRRIRLSACLPLLEKCASACSECAGVALEERRLRR